jgi:protease-4
MGEIMGAETVSRALRRAREDRRVKAIVLRVNSGGGSVFASDEIWHEVSRTVGTKPLVVSFADVAASGGYYIACGADSIFALPNTVTGSIGIISGKLDFSGLYEKIGLDVEVTTRGRFADLSSAGRSYDEEERQIVRAQMRRAYERFIALVAEGRGLTVDSVDALGQGRVWSGTAARELGLVDRHAGLHEVIRTAARMAGVKPGREIAVEILPRPGWQLFDLEPLGARFGSWSGAALPAVIRSALAQLGLADEGLAYRQPYTITIR